MLSGSWCALADLVQGWNTKIAPVPRSPIAYGYSFGFGMIAPFPGGYGYEYGFGGY